jgi:hypothetical protein
VKYNQSTALFNANSAEAPAKINRIVSLLPQISLTTEPGFTNHSDFTIYELTKLILSWFCQAA